MKLNNFFKSALILLVGGFITKLLGFILKIIITREIGTYGIGLYSLIAPVYSLLITIAILSYPIAISKLIAEGKRRSKKIILSIIPVSIFINVITIIIVYLISPIISDYFLKEPTLHYPIIVASLTLPFISLSAIIKGYFWGKQRMSPYMISNILEQVVRLTIIILLIPKVLSYGIIPAISFIIGINVISESASIIIMLLFIPKNEKITLNDFKVNKDSVKDILEISIPATSSKLVGSFFYFLEPIVLTNTLLFVGYSKEFIITEYGILNGYILSLLFLPQFFTQSVSTALVPEVSKLYQEGNKKKCMKRVKQIIIFSLGIGFISTCFIFIFSEFFLKLIFNTNEGIEYIRILAPFTLLYFVDGPIISALQALNKAKINMFITLFGSSTKLIIIFVLSFFHIGIYPLVISIIFNLIIVTSSNYRALKKALS